MRVYGVDFSSAPRPAKPITCAWGWLGVDHDPHDRTPAALHIEGVERFTRLTQFDDFLARPGPWIAGLDFPFSLPWDVVGALGWGADWPGLVQHVAGLGKAAFKAELAAYRDAQPAGHKQPPRLTDRLAGARSPLMVHGVPVGLMFLAGAPRLLQSGVYVAPCHPAGDPGGSDDLRVVIETYPALAARRWTAGSPYKNDAVAQQTVYQRAMRGVLLDGLLTEGAAIYGVRLTLAPDLAPVLLADASGDHLDAVLCAVQAAWAWQQSGEGSTYGVPPGIDAREGWIVDPLTAAAMRYIRRDEPEFAGG